MNRLEYKKMYEVEDGHWWYSSLHGLILHFIKCEGDSLRILDAGCGTGRLCQLMRPHAQVLGCDLSLLALYFCAKRGISSTFQADLNTADLGQEQFDAITSIDVLYHRAIRSDDAVIEKFHRALKPGGVLILNLPAFNFLMSEHDRAVHTARRYRKRELRTMLEQHGFTVEKVSYRMFFLFFAVAAIRGARALFSGFLPGKTASDTRPHSAAVNTVLTWLQTMENRLIERGVAFPFGTSVFAVARKTRLDSDPLPEKKLQ